MHTVISRSTLVKDLSALIVCCDWLIEIGQGNYDIIKQAQSIFSRGLDLVLDNNLSATESVTAPSYNAETLDMDFANFPLQDHEWNTWLESLGLQADAWVDVAGEPSADFPMIGL